jgi:NADPH-dependent 2,4-dienoyl-CoA reductase/sulfur reductase-like enzyme
MADALRRRELVVTLVERLPEVMPSVDEEIGALVRDTLEEHGVHVRTGTAVSAIRADGDELWVEDVFRSARPRTSRVALRARMPSAVLAGSPAWWARARSSA